MTHTLIQIYLKFKEDFPEIKIDYFTFKNIIYDGLANYTDRILMEGNKLYLGHNLSYLQITKVHRNFEKPTIDWPASKKLRSQGIEKVVYLTSPFYFMLYWNKEHAKIKNKIFYRVKFLRGQKGNTKKILSLTKDSFLHHKFPFK